MATRSYISLKLKPEHLEKIELDPLTMLDSLTLYKNWNREYKGVEHPEHQADKIWNELCDAYNNNKKIIINVPSNVDGVIIYCHFDGYYTSGVGEILDTVVNDYDKALHLIALGDTSSLEYGGLTHAYLNDPGRDSVKKLINFFNLRQDYNKYNDEYWYHFDNGTWMNGDYAALELRNNKC